MSKSNLAIIGSAVVILSTVIGMFYSSKKRITEEAERKVTYEVKVTQLEAKLKAAEEKSETLQGRIWTLEQTVSQLKLNFEVYKASNNL